MCCAAYGYDFGRADRPHHPGPISLRSLGGHRLSGRPPKKGRGGALVRSETTRLEPEFAAEVETGSPNKGGSGTELDYPSLVAPGFPGPSLSRSLATYLYLPLLALSQPNSSIAFGLTSQSS